MSALFTSNTDEWATPADLFAALDGEFGFTLDACATPLNAKCPHYFTRDTDGLAQSWRGAVWCNPPYGRTIASWIQKAWESTQAGAVVACLIPARSDTAYWHDYVMRAAEVRFISGRLRFEHTGHPTRKAPGSKGSLTAPFPSALVIFRPDHQGVPTVSAISRTGLPLDSAA